MSGEGTVLEIRDLEKTYIRPSLRWGDKKEKIPALRGLNLDVRAGEIYALLGLNGQGKSTTVRIVLGLCRKDRGSIRLFGRELAGAEEDTALRSRLGYMPETPAFPPYLTVSEVLHFYARLFGMNSKTARLRLQEVLDLVGLNFANRRFGELSKGMTQKAALAQALLQEPDFLILDEPSAGLDPVASHEVREILLALRKRGKTVLLTSHILAEVERTASRVGILHQGRLVDEFPLPLPRRGPGLEARFLKAVGAKAGA